MGSVVEAIVDETAAVALDIYIDCDKQDDGRRQWEGETYRTCDVALLHRLECLGDSVTDFDTAFFELLSGSPKPRVLFDARGEL